MTIERLLKKAMIFTIIFFALSFGWILYLSMNKVITIEGVAQDEVISKSNEISDSKEEVNYLLFDEAKTDSNYLRIPLPENCKADQIVVENHYMDEEVKLYIPHADESFYQNRKLSGNRAEILDGTFCEEGKGVLLTLKTKQIYECRTIFEDQNLYISFLSPREVYQNIVVIDAAHGGMDYGISKNGIDEKDLNLKIAEKVKEKLDSTEIKIYYTRMNDGQVDDSLRIKLGNEVKPGLYIRIEGNESEDPEMYGVEAIYNSDYFIPGFGNVELADMVEREVTTAVKGKALGLKEAREEDQVLMNLKVPATTIKVGFLSNAQERTLLEKEDYIDRIAEGICQAIRKIYGD